MPSCETCHYWAQWRSLRDVPQDYGHCHRYPPVREPGPDPDRCGTWDHPLTDAGDWCGEYRRAPERSDA